MVELVGFICIGGTGLKRTASAHPNSYSRDWRVYNIDPKPKTQARSHTDKNKMHLHWYARYGREGYGASNLQSTTRQV